MELIYLWIDHYANIIKKGFNFSPEYNITYDEETLSIKDKQNNSINLFHENFLNITAIIGENGSGKTSLLSFIEYFFIIERNIHLSCILVLKNNEGKLIIYNGNYSTSKLKVEEDNISFELKELKEIEDFGDVYSSIQAIYYSGGLELNGFSEYNSSYLEVTGSAILKRMITLSNKDLLGNYKWILNRFEETEKSEEDTMHFEQEINRLERWSSPFYRYNNYELQTKIDFVCNHSFEDYDFVPSSMNLTFNQFFFNANIDSFSLIRKFKLEDDFIEVLFRRELNLLLPEESQASFFKEGLLFSIYLFLLYYNHDGHFHKFDLEDLTQRIAEQEGIINKANLIAVEISAANLMYSGWHFNQEALQNFVRRIDIYVDKMTFIENHRRKFTVKIDSALKDLYNNLITFWNINDPVFSFEWMQMSAGQNAILSLFSRLYLLGTRDIDQGKTIWLFIDEGELYLHPEWQRRFFNDLHKFLPKFYPNTKIQLVISTHSPYVASDIPKDNIIMLKRAENTTCDIQDMSTIPETFGANIHELLAHSFFMDHGTIGEFAKGVINDLFNYLTDKETVKKWDPEAAKNAIQIVGEPIIKDQLLMLCDIKFESKSEADHLRVQKARIDARLRELEQDDTN